ncbi:MAG: STAS domain-containing protein [Clostridia bacterium]|nr:STAS domain-containing protein [Clostridia bacterium]
MQITKEKNGNALTISVSGRVDTVTAPELEKFINENIDGVTDLVLDLKEMNYTSSAGLRIILKTQKLMNKQGVMKIVNVQSDVMEVFEMTGFVDIMTIE